MFRWTSPTFVVPYPVYPTMKYINHFTLLFILSLFFTACTDEDSLSPSGETSAVANFSADASGGSSGSSRGPTSGGTGTNPGPDPDLAGTLTAGEWNDLENWGFWRTLTQKDAFRTAYEKWGMDADYRPVPYFPNPRPGQNYQIAFIVDATGSMGDEIRYLQSDLVSLLSSVREEHPNYRIETGFVFYRDQEDEYLTRHLNFSNDVNLQVDWLNEQEANGGGDYPEAVEAGLNTGLTNLSWSTAPGSRLAFLILDAPPHDDDQTMDRYRDLVAEYRAQGIRIIPVAASGVDLSTELLLRLTAIATNGTYTFLTDDSGVGNPHLEPSVGEFEVEYLHDLLVRLIGEYGE